MAPKVFVLISAIGALTIGALLPGAGARVAPAHSTLATIEVGPR